MITDNSFLGYPRPDGQVGIRNHVVVLPTDITLSGLSEQIARQAPGLISLRHSANETPEYSPYHWQMIRGLGLNPNHAAMIIIGSGYETVDIKDLAEELAEKSGKPIFAYTLLSDGGSAGVREKSIETAGKLVKAAQSMQREQCSVSGIILGLQCGGSDALSGITANPAMGVLSDWLVSNGGTSILTEMEELKGTEKFFKDRCDDPELYKRIEANIRSWPPQRFDEGKDYTRGGLSNILEKSLGCYYKGGKAKVTDLIGYAEPVNGRKGLLLMDGTAADVESVCGQFAAGCQVVTFSTGNGNPIGFPSCPVIKLSSNSSQFEALGGIDGDFDINCGEIITEGLSVQQMGERCIEKFLRVLNGELSMCELKNNGGIVGFHGGSTPYA